MSLRPPEKKAEERRNKYKVGVDGDEARLRREDDLVEIRKNRKERLQKKRREALQTDSQPSFAAVEFASPVDDIVTLENLPAMVSGVNSIFPNLQLEMTTPIRKLLSIANGPIEEVIKSGVVQRFVQFLMREDFPQLQLEAAWSLTNIASGTSENTKVVVESGAIPIFVKLLASPTPEVREQAMWALGNVAGDSPAYLDVVLGHGVLHPLLAQIREDASLSMLRNATWVLSNICRGKPQLDFHQIQAALMALQHLVHSPDEEVLSEACWALAYISYCTNDGIQAVIETGVCIQLLELLNHPSPRVLTPALLTFGSLLTGTDLQRQFLINLHVLPRLLNLLTGMYEKNIKKEACRIISIITACNAAQIQAVIDANLIGPLINLLQSGDFDIKKQAAWAVLSATDSGTDEQIKYLVSQGCIKPLCNLLTSTDLKFVSICLEGLRNILKVGENEMNLGLTGCVNLYAQMIEEAGGLGKIEELQYHEDSSIFRFAIDILLSYFAEEEGELEQVAADFSSGFKFN